MNHLIIDERGFGTSERLTAWGEIQELGIRTTAEGPSGEDLFWVLRLAGGTIELPGSHAGGEAIGVLHVALPGVDSRKIVEAMGSTQDRVFRVWHRGERASDRDPETLRERLCALVSRLGGGTDAREISGRVLAAWSDPRRRYHDLEHLADCLRELDAARAPASLAGPVELALYYHDAVYEPAHRGNEAASAAWLEADAVKLQLPAAVTALASRLVAATAHGTPIAVPAGEEEAVALVCDVDLAILGQSALRFLEYEYGVCEEYASIPPWKLRLGRRRVLGAMLASRSLYRTPYFHDRYESRARENLRTLLEGPRYATWWQQHVTARSAPRA